MNMMAYTNDICTIAITLVFVILISKFIPFMKANFSENKIKKIEDIVFTTVESAEQIYKDVKNSGEIKKEYVKRILKEQDIDYTAMIDALIESAVYRLNK